MNNKLLSLAITATVTIILLGSLLVPTIQSEAWDTKEYSNVEQSMFYMRSIDDYDVGTYDINYTSSNQSFTINGVIIPVATGYTWAVFSTGMLRTGTQDFTATVTVTDSGANLAYTASGSTQTFGLPYGNSWIICETPDKYVMMRADTTFTYVSESQPVQFAGLTSIGGVTCTFRMNCNGADNIFLNIVPATVQVSNTVITSQKVTETKEVYKLNNVHFDVTTSGGSGVATYSYGIAYATVTGHNADMPGTGIIAIIPLLIIVGIMVYAVRIIQTRND